MRSNVAPSKKTPALHPQRKSRQVERGGCGCLLFDAQILLIGFFVNFIIKDDRILLSGLVAVYAGAS